MSDAGSTTRGVRSVALRSPVTPPSAFRARSDAGDIVMAVHTSTERVAQSPNVVKCTAATKRDFENLLATQGEYALAAPAVEHARSVTSQARESGVQVERVVKQTIAEAEIRCEITQHEALAQAAPAALHEATTARHDVNSIVLTEQR